MLSASDKPKITVALTGRGVLAATANATKFVLAAAVSGAGALAGVAYARFTSPATLSGHGVLSGTAKASKFILTASWSGHGVLSAVAHGGGFTSLTGTGVLSATVLRLDVYTVHGQLGMLCTNANHTLQSPDAYDLTGSYVFVECVETPSLSDGSTSALFTLYEAPTPGDGYIVSMGYSGGDFICQDNGGSGTSLTTRYSVAFNIAVHKWWRMRESGGVVYWDYSTDSLNWINAASQSIVGVEDVFVEFSTGCSPTAPTPGRAVWDNVNIVTVPSATSGQGVLSATVNIVARTATAVSHGALAGTVYAKPVLPAQLTGSGMLSASARMYRITSTAALTSRGVLTTILAVAPATSRPATLHGAGVLSATAKLEFPVSAALHGNGALTGKVTGPKTGTLFDAFTAENTTT